jgi:hypothetical protein
MTWVWVTKRKGMELPPHESFSSNDSLVKVDFGRHEVEVTSFDARFPVKSGDANRAAVNLSRENSSAVAGPKGEC